MDPNPYLVASSLLFFAPSFLCYTLNLPFLSAIYGLVACVSSTYHATKYPGLLWIDFPLNHLNHIATVVYILQGGWVSMPAYAVWLTYTVYTYYGGYRTSSMIWDPEHDRATPWHAIMHATTAATTMYTVFVTWVALQAAGS
jgi:hypothetical protein